MIFPIALILGLVSQGPSAAPQGRTYRVIKVEADAFLVPKVDLLGFPRVVADLKPSADQKARLPALNRQFVEARRASQSTDGPEMVRADLLRKRIQAESALGDLLTPAQKVRLDQVQLQLQGPMAFASDDLPGRLKLLESKLRQVRTVVDEGARSIAKAATIAATLKAGEPPKTFKQVAEIVGSKEFRASKDKAWAEIFEIRRAAQKRVDQALTDRQRLAYKGMLGKPFDVEAFWREDWPGRSGPDGEAVEVATQLGFDGGQRTDPDFDTRVLKPAYPGDRHPTVLFDEAHSNFHTSQGRYKVFADLMTGDGYKVTPNRLPFNASRLAGFEILIIANAMTGQGANQPDPARSAFTDAECDAVRDWVEAGGSLLLVTDCPPFGAASASLAKRFDVDTSLAETFDPANAIDGSLAFSREKGLLGDHAITRGRDPSERVERVLTFGGQSLQGPPGSVAILKFADSAFDWLDNRRFPASGRAQGIAFARGKGRVVMMAEAGQLSAQTYGLPPIPMGMNVPGSDNRKMALNTMHWLSRLID